MRLALGYAATVPAAQAVEFWAEQPVDLVTRRAPGARRSAPSIVSQDLQWLRERLLFAFIAPSDYRDDRPEQKLLGAFDTTGTRDAFPRYRAQELAECPADCEGARRLPLDYVVSLARDTTRVTVSETRKKKGSSHPLAPTAFEDAHLVRIVGALEPMHRHWLRYTYADSRDWADEAGAVVELWRRVVPSLGKLQGKTLQKLKGLAHMAVQHGKRHANDGSELYKAARVAELLGVTATNYDQHWRSRWQALLAGLEQLDEEALRLVLREFNQ
jgi:hypothetical protein